MASKFGGIPVAEPVPAQSAAVRASKFGGVPVESGTAAPSVETPAAQQEAPDMLSRIGEMFTGSERETRATEELPELQGSGLLSGLDIPAGQAAALTAALSTMTDPAEIAKTLQSASPDIGIQQDEKGNLIAANNKTGARAVLNKPGFSGMDALQTAAIGSAFTPAGRGANLVGGGIARQALALGAGSAATQAAIEGAQAGAGGEFNEEEVALSGALGAATPLALGTIGAGADAVRRGAQALRSQPGAQAPLVKAAEQARIPLMTSDVSPPVTPIGQLAQRAGERVPYAGTGAARATQQDARRAAVQELGANYPVPKPDQIINSLKNQTSRVKKAAGQRYEQLVPMVDSLGPVQYPRATKAIDDAIAELSKPGVVGSKEAVQELQQFKQTLGAADQTYSTLKENRTALRDIVSAYDAQGRSQLPSRAKALLNGVYSSITGDMDEAARSALSPRDFARLKEANALYASEAAKLTRTRLKNVLDKGDLTPEVAENLIFSAKPSEVKSLYNSLDSDGRDAMRATIVQRAINKAGGLDDVSPDKFLNELRRLESQTGVAFKGDQRRQIEGLKEVLAATKRAGQTGITNTGQEAFVPLTAAAVGSALGDLGATLAAGVSAGAIARAYESQVVRNALIRIGSAPKSEASKRLALQLARQMSAGIQSARSQEPAKQQQSGR